MCIYIYTYIQMPKRVYIILMPIKNDMNIIVLIVMFFLWYCSSVLCATRGGTTVLLSTYDPVL